MTRSHRLANKRILLFLPALELGGAERQAIHLARYLKRSGCDVRVWANSGSGHAAEQLTMAGIPCAVQASIWPCRKRHLPRTVWRVIQTISALRRLRPDVIYAYCPRPCISSGVAWKWSPAKAFIWGQRDSDDLRGDLIERYAYRRASAVVCNAAHEVGYLERTLGAANAPISVVHNGLEFGPHQGARTEWRATLGIADDAIVATMLANFRFQKDHSTLLLAWSELEKKTPEGKSQPRLLLAGAPQESVESVRKLVDKLQLHDSVIFLGQVKDVAGLLASSDIGVLTTHHEGLSNSIIEYMACGLPVVVTDIPSNRETLGDTRPQQYCKRKDPADLADRLNILMASCKLREELGKRNQQRARQAFSVKTMCEQTVSIIEAALDAA